MSITELPVPAVSDDEQEALRARVNRIGEAEGLNKRQLADEADIAYGTFTGWLSGEYQGRNDKIAAKVRTWLASREELRQASAAVPAAPPFVRTRSAELFIQKLRTAQVMPDFVAIVGAPGVGKTETAKHYRKENPHVWLATMNPYTSSVHGMLNELADTLGVVERSAAMLPRAIGRKIEDTGGLIIIDEAQNLQPSALDMLRSFYDRYEVGVALIGNEAVLASVAGGRRAGSRAYFAQLSSRLGERVIRPKPYAADIDSLIAAWGIEDKAEITELRKIAARPGALREMTKVLVSASMLAAGGDEPRGLRHIKAAWSRRAAANRDAEAA